MSSSKVDWGTIDKKSSNANLLGLLTRRKAESMTHLPKRDWPGKLAPSFAANHIRTQKDNNFMTRNTNSSAKKSQQRARNKVQSVKVIRNIPIAKMGSISLSIQPTSRSKTILMNTTWKTNFTANSNLRIKQTPETKGRRRIIRNQHVQNYNYIQSYNSNQSPNTQMLVQTAFQNNRLNTAITKNRNQNQDDLLLQNQKDDFNIPIKISNDQIQFEDKTGDNINQIKSHILESYQMQKNSNKKKNIIDMSHSNNTSVTNSDPLNNYIVDYSAFNYVDKIVDNPQKWMKFVRKKTNTVQDHTSKENKQEKDKVQQAHDLQFLTGIN